MKLDVAFDFTSDTPNYWKDFWNDSILGGGGADPDIESKTLQAYHQLLWSKPLPNGEQMNLTTGIGYDYLTWKNFRFGSDSILASFRYKRYRKSLEEVSRALPNYQNFIEGFMHKAYTIGGSIIFPKENSINRARGINPFIKDRWDLTLECIRRYYHGEDSPLHEALAKNEEFFNLFVNFKGYVDFFYLQDCVSADYRSVIFWIGGGDLSKPPLPQTTDEYLTWIEKQLAFVSKRNRRIALETQL